MSNKKVTKKKTKKRCTDPRTLKVTDNIPEGSRLDVSADLFVAIFGNDLLKHYTPKDKDKK